MFSENINAALEVWQASLPTFRISVRFNKTVLSKFDEVQIVLYYNFTKLNWY